MTKKKRISINAFERVVEESRTQPVSFEWRGLEVTVSPIIGIQDVVSFVKFVVDNCFVDDDVYVPEIKDLLIKSQVLETYANFTMPRNIDKRYDLIYNTDIVDVVLEHVNSEQFHEIVAAINRRIDNKLLYDKDNAVKNLKALVDTLSDFSNGLEGVTPEEIKGFIRSVTDSKLDEEKLVQAYISSETTPDGN